MAQSKRKKQIFAAPTAQQSAQAAIQSTNQPGNRISTIMNTLLENFGTMLLIFAAFLIGVLWTEVRYLKKGGYAANTGTAGGNTQANQQAAPTAPPEAKVTKEQIQGLVKGDTIKFGKEDSKLTFVEFSDPSCPYCHVAGGKNPELNKSIGAQFTLKADGGSYVPPVPEIKKLVDQGKASFVWVYSPGHGNGEMGTQALYCANEKGKFWPVHDMLMSSKGYDLLNNTVKNDKTKSQVLADFLKPVYNTNDMKSCLDSGKYAGKIAQDTATARQLGVTGTPGFFVNETRYKGAYSFTDMEQTVNSLL